MESYQRILDSPVKPGDRDPHVLPYGRAEGVDRPSIEEDITKVPGRAGPAVRAEDVRVPLEQGEPLRGPPQAGLQDVPREGRGLSDRPDRSNGLWNERPVYYVDQKSHGAESLMMKYVDLCARTSAVFHLWTHPWSLVMEGDPNPNAQDAGPRLQSPARDEATGRPRCVHDGGARRPL
jgi:hypothetical protein